MNLEEEPSGEKFTLRFGRRRGLMPFVFITTAMGYLMTTGSQGLGFICGDSSALVRWYCFLLLITESQNGRGWKEPLWVI